MHECYVANNAQLTVRASGIDRNYDHNSRFRALESVTATVDSSCVYPLLGPFAFPLLMGLKYNSVLEQLQRHHALTDREGYGRKSEIGSLF